MEFREISFGSRDYRKACELRNAVLREPLGLSLWAEDLSAEEEQLHFALVVKNSQFVACGVILFLEPTHVKIRQIAVEPAMQGQGWGRVLLAGIEEAVRKAGARSVTLNARATSVGFYQRLGYEAVGEEFEELALPHQVMNKNLRH